MNAFASFGEFAEFLVAERIATVERNEYVMEKVAKVVEKEAKSLIGHYQPETPPFAGWAELADSTKADRVASGFSENDPLLRTGEMRDSIEHRSDRNEAVIGSDSDIAVYQELGTEKIPPRSFLGMAAVNKGEEVAKMIGRGFVSALVGKDVFGGSIDL